MYFTAGFTCRPAIQMVINNIMIAIPKTISNWLQKPLYVEHNRLDYYSQTTIGVVKFLDLIKIFSLEDTVRPDNIKVKKHTAIFAGVYLVSIRYSNKFKRDVLCLSNQKDLFTIFNGIIKFTYVYSHGGNKHQDTDACILVAFKRGENTVWDTAEHYLFNAVKEQIENGYRVYWRITNGDQTG